MVKGLTRRILLGGLIPAAILVVWHIASAHSVVVPSIGEVVEVLSHPFREPASLDSVSLASSVVISLLRVLCGFSLAALTGIPLGLLIGRCRLVRELFAPTMAAAMAVSPIAWVPVTIIVFGLASPATVLYGQDYWRHDLLDRLRFAIIAVIWLGAFFPIAVNVASGAAAVRASHCETVEVLGATRRQVFTKVILPAATPAIVTGLRVGVSIAWRVIIAAELFPGTRSGLGYMISTSHEVVAYEYAFAAIIAIAAVGLALDGVLRLLARRVGRWQPKER